MHDFDPAAAAAFLARARAGETIAALVREPGMPRWRTYRRWVTTQPPFAEAVWALRQRRDQQLGVRGRARYRAFDSVLADRIIVGLNAGARLEDVLAADPALPCKPTLRRWRRQQPAFDAVLRRLMAAMLRRKRQAALGCTPARTAAICDHIREGGTFTSYAAAHQTSRTTLRLWLRSRPAFARAVAAACEEREDWYREHALALADDAARIGVEAARAQIMLIRRHLVRLRHRPGAVHRRRASTVTAHPSEG